MVDFLADPKVYGDVEHCGWTTEEEEYYEPRGKEETRSDEDEVPLPQPGDMHVEFKKSSLPDRAKKPKIEFIPFRLLQENKQELCKKDTKLGAGDRGPKGPKFYPQAQIKEEAYAINKTITFFTNKGDIITWVWALPLATAKLGGVPRYRITITFIFTVFLSSILLVIS